jgi:Salmonella virulence plasmid 65kDa B protein
MIKATSPFTLMFTRTAQGSNTARAHEANRTERGNQTYLKKIQYGNLQPYSPDWTAETELALPSDWMFSVVLDYGDHTASPPTPQSDTPYCSSIIFPESRPPGRTANGGIQLLDLAGSGQLDVVELTDPDPGFFKRTTDGDWAEWIPDR